MAETDYSDHESAEPHRHRPALPSQRVQALADGIFAIAMTLLVFNIHLPDWKNLSTENTFWSIPGAIFLGNGQGSVLIAYVMSFMLLGVHWVSHHAHFQYIRRVNRTLLWINILFFLLIAFVPFTTQLVGSGIYWDTPSQLPAQVMINHVVVVIYGVHLMLIAAVTLLHWWYGTTHPELTNGPIESRVMQVSLHRILAMLLFSLLAMLLSFVHPLVSVIAYLLIPIYYILPGRIDRHWRGETEKEQRRR
jgi:uncharacterized membrane protein